MSTHFDSFDISPVPAPAWDAAAPENFRGIYGMPSFVTVTTSDMAASVTFWTGVLGFFSLFEIPGRLVHLRRWAFQDVLLVPGTPPQEGASSPAVNFACVLAQIEQVSAACEGFDGVVVSGPRDTPWNSREVEVLTPEGIRVVFTAAKPYDPATQEAANLRAVGITAPAHGVEDNEAHGR
ncbi:VOC family protein [Kocuria varians]|uniref:VOC family protein n=1 Tax=Kocuria varians TaxID=1272 RepID=UPI0008394168|nr:VOC family protein [Kocuria varians]